MIFSCSFCAGAYQYDDEVLDPDEPIDDGETGEFICERCGNKNIVSVSIVVAEEPTP